MFKKKRSDLQKLLEVNTEKKSGDLNTYHAKLSGQISKIRHEITVVIIDVWEGAKRHVPGSGQSPLTVSALVRSPSPGPHTQSLSLRNLFIFFSTLVMDMPLKDRFTFTKLARLTYKTRITFSCFYSNKYSSQGSWHSWLSALTLFSLGNHTKWVLTLSTRRAISGSAVVHVRGKCGSRSSEYIFPGV